MNNKTTYTEFLAKVKNSGSLKSFYENEIDRIKNEDKKYNSFISFNDSIIEDISNIENRLSEGKKIPFAGFPIGIKDNIAVKNMTLTCASHILENFTPPYESTAVERLKNNGFIVIGKNNMDEFAMGSTTQTSCFGATKNPINPDYIPGGSSGGSAACVAAGLVPAALGSDTGGSVRQPASFCGIVGFKPSYGLISRYGLNAFASSLDHIGTLTNNCSDAALIINAMRGADSCDSTCVNKKIENLENFSSLSIKGKKFGIIKEMMSDKIDVEITKVIREKIEQIKLMGGIVEEISIPEIEWAVSIYYIISSAEASSNLARYDGIRFGLHYTGKEDVDSIIKETRSCGFGDEVKRRIVTGNLVLSSKFSDKYYKKAEKARVLLNKKLNASFEKYDFLISPTTPIMPFKIGEKNEEIKIYNSDFCTIPANLAGLPAISIPAGKTNLPIGMQIIGPKWSDGILLGISDFIMKGSN